MINDSGINSHLVNGSGWTNPDLDTYTPDKPYTLHVHNEAGTLLGVIEEYIGGNWKSAVNNIDTLSFTLPLDSPSAQSGLLAYPNRVYLYDSKMELLQQFVVVGHSAKYSKGELRVECSDLSYLLNQEFVPLDATINGTNFALWIKSIMDLQVNANPITIGYIHPTILAQTPTVSGAFDRPILDALNNTRKAVGGIISIDPQGRLRWDVDTSTYSDFTLTLYNDIEEYTEKVDSDKVVNRLYVDGHIYAQGATNHIRQTIPGGYVEDTDSQAIYGIRAKRITINSVTSDEMLDIANRILDYLKSPIMKRSISAIDLEKVQFNPDDSFNPHPKYLYAGANIRVIPPPNVPNATPFIAKVLGITRNLNDYMRVKVDVGDVDPRKSYTSGNGGEGEPFDALDNDLDNLERDVEALLEQDVDIWDVLDDLLVDFAALEEPETDVNEIQAVGAANLLGSNLKFAPSDHEHEGIIKIHNASYDQVSELPTPSGMAIAYISDDTQGEGGWYKFPEYGTTNADWEPLVTYA